MPVTLAGSPKTQVPVPWNSVTSKPGRRRQADKILRSADDGGRMKTNYFCRPRELDTLGERQRRSRFPQIAE